MTLFSPTWAKCYACGEPPPGHGPEPEHFGTIALVMNIPLDLPLWLEVRQGRGAVLWCACGARPVLPELLAHHNRRARETLGRGRRRDRK